MVPEEDIRKLDKDYKPTRAERRRKPLKPRYNIIDRVIVPSNILTSPSHMWKKLRKKNAPTRQQRIRTIAKARKARKATYSQVS